MPPSGSDASVRRSPVLIARDWVRQFGTYVVALAALLAAVVGLRERFLELGFGGRSWMVVALLPLVAAFVGHGLPALLQRWRDRQLRLRGISGRLTDPRYFRVSPYQDSSGDRERFGRSDRQHVKIAEWISAAEEPILYLTGVSGSGKSSLLNAHVLPELREADPPTLSIVVRGFRDPLEALHTRLRQPGVVWKRPPEDGAGSPATRLFALLKRAADHLRGRRLLIVFDQFEEFLIIHERETSRLEEVKAFFHMLCTHPVPGIELLLVLRTDYIGMLGLLRQDSGLPALRMHSNWESVSAFRERDAREFLATSGLKLGPALQERVFREIRDIEETEGLVRPITLNMVGLVLDRAATGGTPVHPARGKGNGLVRGYVRSCLIQAEVKAHAREILSRMITPAGTKAPRPVVELAAETGLSAEVITGCLLILAEQGLVRRLDAVTRTWEISHDFVARLMDRILSGWRRGLVERLRFALFPASLVLWLAAFVLLPILVESGRRLEPSDVTATLTYSFEFDPAELDGAPEPVFEDGWGLTIRACSVTNKNSPLPQGWRNGFLLKTAQLRLSAREQTVNWTESRTVDGPSHQQRSTFKGFVGDLGPFEELNAWEGAQIEGLLAAKPAPRWLLAARGGFSMQRFWDFYGTTHGELEESLGSDYGVAPLPVQARLSVYVRGRQVAALEGYLASVHEHDEDVRDLCVCKFRVVRASFSSR